MSRATAAVVASLCLVVASPAGAVYGGTEDGTAHPNVGEVFYFNGAEGIFWSCSGVLLAPQWFLTAGHCSEGYLGLAAFLENVLLLPDRPLVHFAPDLYADAEFDVYETDGAFTMNGYVAIEDHLGLGPVNDVGLIHLAEPVQGLAPMALPPANLVASIPHMAPLQIVGYGLAGWRRGGGTPGGVGYDVRRSVAANLLLANPRNRNTNTSFLHVSQPTAQGGGCFGDSGGPVLYEGQLIAIESYGVGGRCGGHGYSFRVDRPAVLAWLVATMAP